MCLLFISSYPEQLAPVRDIVLGLVPVEEQSKLLSCRYKSQCNSVYCPLCSRQSGHKWKGRILEAAGTLSPKRLRFATFTTRDVPLGDLRATAGHVMDATRRTLKSLKVSGYAARLEVSFEEWAADDCHPHVHILVDSHSGGRSFIPVHAFTDTWLESLPSNLHPVDGGAHVKPVRILDAAAAYMTKSPFHEHVKAEEAARIVQVIAAMKGLQKFTLRGSMTTAAQCAAA